MVRFQIALRESEFNALRQLSKKEYRDHRQQAGLLIRESLERRGLIDGKVSTGFKDRASDDRN